MAIYGVNGSVGEPMELFFYDDTTGDLIKRKTISQAGTFSEFIGHDEKQVTIIGKPIDTTKNAITFRGVTLSSNITHASDQWFKLEDYMSNLSWSPGYSADIYGDKFYTLSDGLFKSYDMTTGTVETLNAIPDAYPNKMGYSLVVYNNKIYVYGGWASGDATARNKLYEYDISNNTWATKATGPTAPSYHCSRAYNGKLYIFSGTAGTSPTASPITNILYSYDITNNSWSSKSSCPTALSSAQMFNYDRYLYVIGGYNSGIKSYMYRYDTENNVWSSYGELPLYMSPSSYSTYYACGCLYNGKIYNAFGTSNLDGTYSSRIYEYDILDNTWTQKTSGPEGRYGSGGFLYNSKFIVVGGYLSTGVCRELWEYII